MKENGQMDKEGEEVFTIQKQAINIKENGKMINLMELVF